MPSLNPTAWLAAILIVIAAFAGGYLKGDHDASRQATLENKVRVGEANVEAFKASERRQRNSDEASTLAALRATDDRNRAARAGDAYARLLDALDATERVATAAGHASAETVAALRTDLRSCAAEYRTVGEQAAGHASDSLMYQQAWPK